MSGNKFGLHCTYFIVFPASYKINYSSYGGEILIVIGNCGRELRIHFCNGLVLNGAK
jgi:hypothetical protein